MRFVGNSVTVQATCHICLRIQDPNGDEAQIIVWRKGIESINVTTLRPVTLGSQ